MSRHVLFVHAPIPGARFSSSIAALSAWLKAHGHTTALLVVPPGTAPDAVRPLLRDARPDVVAFSYMTCRAQDVARLVAAAREELPHARLVAGGAHPTSYPRETLAALPLDAVCVGEGEAPLLAFVEAPDAPHPGLVRRGHDDAVTRWWAMDVDALPDWDRALFGDVRNDGNRYERAVGVAFARGFCPYTCTFCGVDGYRRLNAPPKGAVTRLRSVDRVLREMEGARALFPDVDAFASWDEILPGSRRWQRAFMEGYRERIGLPLSCHLRVEQVTDDLVESLVLGGCDYVVLGVETGDEGYRRKFLDKGFSNADARAAFAKLHAAGIATFLSFMIGLPFETPQMLKKTVQLARELAATTLSWKYYTPERGTRLFGLVERHGLVIDRWVDHPFGGEEAMVQMTHCTQRDLDVATAALRLIADAQGSHEEGERERERERGTFAGPPRPELSDLALELRA
ncbi:MAG: B12-binding domain-containing radical SAM protein [Deltaproteobacteria bacterium]|nr:MAG: B12-binding domain-containing radical SAM protein [Deltaproteobacteria bacterium]